MKLVDIKHIAIIGLGYVGFVTGLCLASKGYITRGLDVIPEVVRSANQGKIPFYEPKLEPLLKAALKTKQFAASTDYNEVIPNSDLIYITVGTPPNRQNAIDLSYLKSAAHGIATHLDHKYRIVIVKSTVVPGTTDGIVLPILERESGLRAGRDFGLCMNPEFLKEGNAVDDFFHPDRTVIGSYLPRSGEILEQFTRPFGGTIFRTNLRTAEMIKYANNAFLATKISYINEIANICRLIEGVDVRDVAHGIGLDERISPKFLRAGCGFGGSCFPKDVQALISYAKVHQYAPIILDAVIKLNEFQAQIMIDLALSVLDSLANRKIAILGLAFKPNTSDMRKAASLRIIKHLQKFENIQISAYDPVAIPEAKKILGSSITYCSSVKECLKDAEVCFIVTEWDQFKTLSPSLFKNQMKSPIIIDGRMIYDYQTYSKETTLLQIGYSPPV
ncbi:MAG: UDP-glucose dehydrogenase family protein [Candidatus Helarchaeota archaeon]